MNPTPAAESALAERLRKIFRAYRYSGFCPAHGLMRRVFRAMIQRHQRIRLGNGIRLEIDLASEVQQSLFWVDGELEPQLEWVIRELMPEGSTCVDCGANCGYIGLLARRYRLASVWFIEPHPRLAQTIRRNVELNGWTDSCHVIEAAASDHDGEAILYVQAQKDGSHSLIPDWSPAGQKGSELKVRVGRLPILLGEGPEFERIGLLKIDAEGRDFAILKGLGNWLAPERIGMIYVELAQDREAAFGILERAGFVGFGQPQLSSGEARRRFMQMYAGRPVVLFEPLDLARHGYSETLWLPKDGPAVTHLATVARRAG